MPCLVYTINQIMDREKRDLFLIDFNGQDFSFERTPDQEEARRVHLSWFDQQNLEYETACPTGWLEGDPNIFAVFFDGADDPRLAAYSAQFEDPTGTFSLQPDAYQMKIISYQGWLENGGPERLRQELDFEP